MLRTLALRYRAVGLATIALAVVIALTSPVGAPASAVGSVAVGGATGQTATAVTVVPGGASTAATTVAGATGSSTSSGRVSGGSTAAAAALQPKNCDPATGRVKFPSVFSPPCVQPVVDNGGSTYQGVSKDEIKLVIYAAQPNPSVDALVRAAGASDTREDVLATYHDWIEMFENTFETYGRRVKLEVIDASGASDDDAAARADAIKVATEMKPFAVFGGPEAFVDELASRGVVMITQLQRPAEYFAQRAPFVFGTQMSSTQAFRLLAEYIGKRLAGHNATHAGDAATQGASRKFGLVYLDTPEGIYKPGVDVFERDLAEYGVSLTDKISYEGDINRAQEQARVIIARLKDKGITSVVFSGDPIAPIFLTQEATAQGYHPEWVIPGGTLVDTNFFGRTYDQDQWSHAFGISQLWIRPPQEQTEVQYQHRWFFGRPPTAKASNEVLYQEVFVLLMGIHMAGANLNPRTFRDGLFSMPVGGAGRVTQVQRSFGPKGGWDFDDYTAFDTVTEVWWDPNATGADEVGNDGTGMFEFVDGGKRYAPGQWPSTEPAVFDPSLAITHYDALPPSDVYPTYPRPH
ncbi:MAG: hypothetical protein V7636_251 [Actinomycetota bacterium]|jgi:hypothetical protein